MFCTNCGRKIPDGVKFCPYCGHPVTTPSPKDRYQDVEESKKGISERKKQPDEEIKNFWDKAKYYLGNKEYGKYMEYIEKILSIDPNNAKVWNNKGLALNKLGRYKEAIECFDRTIEIDSDDYMPWNGKGLALNYLGRYKEAIECFDRSIEIDPDDNIGWYGKGLALLILGRYKEAAKCYDKAKEIHSR